VSRGETEGVKDEEEGEEVEEERKVGSVGRCVSRKETEGAKEEGEEVEEGKKVTVWLGKE